MTKTQPPGLRDHSETTQAQTGSLATTVLSRPACEATCDQHPEHIYVLCYGRPTLITDRDWHPDDPRGEGGNYPISHYVGWTRQRPPDRRVRQHGARSARFIVEIVPGTKDEEPIVKASGRCPGCDGSPDYFAESPHRASRPHAARSRG